jgi:hypothetical protein
MKGLFKYGAIASIFLLTAGSAAFAQSYNSSGGSDWNQGRSWNQGASGSGWNQGSGSGWNQGGYSGNSQGWNQGSGSGQGWRQSGTPSGGWNQGGFSGSSQSNGQSWNNGQNPSQQDAYQELSKYGFNNIRNLQRSEGWEAHATKNGDRVHIFIDDDGMIATYRGE